MNVEPMYSSLLNGITSADNLTGSNAVAANGAGEAQAFENVLSQTMESLNGQQVASNEAITGLITGDVDNLHNVMIQTIEAQLSLELAIQVRNKAIEAYNDVKNMQF